MEKVVEEKVVRVVVDVVEERMEAVVGGVEKEVGEVEKEAGGVERVQCIFRTSRLRVAYIVSDPPRLGMLFRYSP